MRRLIAALVITITLTAATACTPAQVTAFFASQGRTIDQPTAAYVARALTVWDAQQRALLAYLTAVDAQRSCHGPADCPALIRRVFTERGLASQAEAAVRVAACESGFNPRAYNPSGASGLFQHLISYWLARAAGAGSPGASPFDPWVNTVAAANMVAASGWSAWVCRP